MQTQTKNEKRPLNGILLLDKSKGLSSNQVLQKVKRLFNAKKAGHTGSLDPIATGMLPICFGQATKFCQYLLNADKCYEATGRLGIITTTSDETGEIISRTESPGVDRARLLSVLESFKGKQTQLPSMYSALKHQGVPLYKLARQGKTVERKAREIRIDQIDLQAYEGEYFKIKVQCSKGTYIRNLVEDIGQVLGVGAHLTELHRVFTARFEQSPMFDLPALQDMSESQRDNLLLPLDRAIHHLPKLYLSYEETARLQQGLTVESSAPVEPTELFRIYDHSQVFIGVGMLTDTDKIKAHRLMAY